MSGNLRLQIRKRKIDLRKRLGIAFGQSDYFGRQLLDDTLHLAVQTRRKRSEPFLFDDQSFDFVFRKVGITNEQSGQ